MGKKNKPIKESLAISAIASMLLNEIEHFYRPLIEHINSKTFLSSGDHFNPIRILMPLVETASEFEFGGDPVLLLEKLDVKDPDLIWRMFRHGLSHHIRPFYAVVDGVRINWAIPQFPTEHYKSADAIGIYPPKLLNDLEAYLEGFRYNGNMIEIQTGIELI